MKNIYIKPELEIEDILLNDILLESTKENKIFGDKANDDIDWIF